MVRLQENPIDPGEFLALVRTDRDGAVALFLGTVRDHHEGRKVLRLEYHAYREMAVLEMKRVVHEARARWPVTDVALVHRYGNLAIGEVSVAVAVSSPHRAEAFDACRFVIDTVKHRVPIWKKEFFEEGEAWVEGC